jgi:hypothetical protein
MTRPIASRHRGLMRCYMNLQHPSIRERGQNAAGQLNRLVWEDPGQIVEEVLRASLAAAPTRTKKALEANCVRNAAERSS